MQLAQGLQRGDRVAILAANGQLQIEATYAALWAGDVALPINSRFAMPEMIEQLLDAQPAILIAGAGAGGRGQDLRLSRRGRHVRCVRHCGVHQRQIMAAQRAGAA